jgi:hypothetical protein
MLLDHQIHQFVSEKIFFQYAPPTQGTYNPTLILGLGGTGIKVLRYLKKHMKRIEAQQIALLGIDSDVSENDKFPELPKLSDRELVVLDGQVAAQTLAGASAAPAQHPHIIEFLPNTHGGHGNLHHSIGAELRTNQGAGQFRRSGRLFFLSNLNNGGNVLGRLSDVHRRLVSVPEVQRQHQENRVFVEGTRVFIVTSLSGGTGAGSLMDLLAAIRSIFVNPLDATTVLGVLPGPLLDRQLKDPPKEKPQTRGNALGLLRDLQAGLLGELDTIPFQLGDHAPFTPGNRGLLDACYLIDQNLYNGTTPRDYFDLCNGVALFLYALVGSGVGAEQASGEINTRFLSSTAEERTKCFRALGVASIAYPLDDLGEYAIRHVMARWLEKWLAEQANHEAVANALANVKTALAILDSGTFSGRIRLDISDREFFPSAGDRQALLRQSDHDFVAARTRRYAQFESVLQRYSRQIEDLSTGFVSRNDSILSDFVRSAIGVSKAHAESAMSALRLEIEELQHQWINAKQTRQDRIGKILAELPGKEKWIHFNDWNDQSARRKYIALVQELFHLKYEAAFDAEVDEVLSHLVQRVKQWESWVIELGHGFERDLQHNLTALANIDSGADYSGDADFGVVQSALARTEFKAWASGVVMTWPTEFHPASPDKLALVTAVWTQMLPPFIESLKGLDLLALAKMEVQKQNEGMTQKTHLLNAIAALDKSAIPVIQLTDTAPLQSAMAPDKFIAGKDVRSSNSWVQSNFSPVAGGQDVKLLDISSQHFLLCIQTLKGFAASHWRGFENAYRIFEQDPWWFSVFPDTVRISPLISLGVADQACLKALGLGLMSGLIVRHGNAFYSNLTTDSVNVSYSIHRIEPGPVAEKLLVENLVGQGDPDILEPSPDRCLGANLTGAVELLKTSALSDLVDSIVRLFDRIPNRLGKTWTKECVEDFMSADLGHKFGDTQTEKPLCDRIREALRLYVSKL